MTKRLPQIFIGDYVRAVRTLDAEDEETRRAIACLLGLREEVTQKTSADEKKEADAAGEKTTLEAEKKKDVDEDKTKRSATVEGGKVLPSGLEQISSGAKNQADAPDWLRLSGSLRAVASAASPASAETAFEPLLVPRWVRGILTALLSTRSPDGAPDTERAVELLARGELLRELPRLPELTTRHGVQLLLDMGDGMLPFSSDVSGMARDVVHVIGEAAASVLRFMGTPLRGAGMGPRRDWKEYRPPPPSTPVMLLTDLGIGRPAAGVNVAGTDEWLEFANLLRRAGCPAVALVPYPEARWPRSLARTMTIVEWDRPTTIATARRLVGRGLEVKG